MGHCAPGAGKGLHQALWQLYAVVDAIVLCFTHIVYSNMFGGVYMMTDNTSYTRQHLLQHLLHTLQVLIANNKPIPTSPSTQPTLKCTALNHHPISIQC